MKRIKIIYDLNLDGLIAVLLIRLFGDFQTSGSYGEVENTSSTLDFLKVLRNRCRCL